MEGKGTHAERLSADDAAIFALESGSIAGHTLKLLVLEADAEPLDLDRLRAAVGARLDSEPRGRQRVDLPPGEPERARWLEDDAFEIDAHIRRREATEGIDMAGLWRVTGEIMSRRLDHGRPLWAMDLVGPLADGREAIVVRIHHAMADGIGCMRFLDGVLWDAEAPPPSTPAKRDPPRGRSRAREAARLPGALRRELGGRTGASPFDRPIGQRRELAFAATSLAELKRVGASRPGHVTVNDVLLAALAGGLRAWLVEGAGAATTLRAQVPVSLHHRDEGDDDLGNRDSFLNIDLPLAEPDPLVRLDRIHAETAERKRLGDAEELYDFFHALARFKHLGRAVERFAGSPSEFSLSISNVPGPRAPVSVLERRVERLGSVAEPANRHALRVCAISCAGDLAIGLCTDPEALPGVTAIAGAVDRGLEELRRAAIG